MRKTATAWILTAGVTVLLGGCAMHEPSYREVREEAVSLLDQIVAVVPDPKEVVPQLDSRPYSCGDELLLSQSSGAFYTGRWVVNVPEELDLVDFTKSLPELLGDNWEERDLGVDVSFANVDLLYKPLGLTVSVEEAIARDRPALELLVISRCGILPDNADDDDGHGSLGPRGVRGE